MTTRTWEFMLLEDRVRMVVEMFPTLEPDVAQQKIAEWATGEYDDSWHGEQRAIADLIELLKDAVLSPEQRAQERDRIAQLVKDKMK